MMTTGIDDSRFDIPEEIQIQSDSIELYSVFGDQTSLLSQTGQEMNRLIDDDL
jgi:hypothetical protein